ncbi:biotinidase-like isoform X2 [Anguilla anguilla]|uniref:biotinidase-like isoform X2 n=1 Tax=Anguilla anguilla TaxID=7936 RepID=UPI0015AE4CB9|nr:biotinidase-like isoform X2 [Anguilla anguilla]
MSEILRNERHTLYYQPLSQSRVFGALFRQMGRVDRRWSDQGSTMAWCILGAAVLMLSLGVDGEGGGAGGGEGGGAGGGSYVAAVYEHHLIGKPQPKVPLSRQEALEHMNKNLDVYEEQAAAAAKQGRVDRWWYDLGSAMAQYILRAASVLLLSLGVDWAGGGAGGGSYVAAVYEHNITWNPQPKVPLSRQEALEHMNKNLDLYEQQAAAAAKQGAHIIVFPEDGIHGFTFTRESIAGYLETVPDPKAVSWNPCSDPTRFPNTEVQHRLSCMAKSNSLYLVANMAGREDCDAQTPPCPPDGRYQFNTNVVFSANGTLVARYRKRNLYIESEFEFDTPADPQLITFDTPFAGRFGLFICFDILFYNPAMELVEKLGVRQLVFSTAWVNTLPLMDAVQFHRSFSYATNTTLLSANLRIDGMNTTGSGIYSPWGFQYYHAQEGEPKAGRLLVQKLPVLDSLRPDLRPHSLPLPPPISGDQEPPCYQQVDGECQRTVPEGRSHPEDPAAPSSPFKADMIGDNYTMVLVEGAEGNLSVCDNALCCHLQFRRRTAPQELYALAAFDGLHKNRMYLQVCALIRCSGLTPQTCGKAIDHADTLLDFQLMGNFSTRHVFPSVLGSHMYLDRIDHSGWGGRGFYMSCHELVRGLVTAALCGRAYDRDHTLTSP